jgi:hypothetical protein
MRYSILINHYGILRLFFFVGFFREGDKKKIIMTMQLRQRSTLTNDVVDYSGFGWSNRPTV